MKGKTTIVYFGKNHDYAERLCSEDTLVNLVSDNGRCVEFIEHEGKTVEVARDGIEGDSEFIIFEDKFLDNMFEYTYDMIETIKSATLGKDDDAVDKLKEKFGVEDFAEKIKSHFEKNEEGRRTNFERAEAERKSAYVSLSDRQEYMLSDKEKELVLAEKEKLFKPREYKEETFEEFIKRIGRKEDIVSTLVEHLGDQISSDEISKLEQGNLEVLKGIVIQGVQESGVKVKSINPFFNSSGDRKQILSAIESELKTKVGGEHEVETLKLIDELLWSKEAEKELYSIISEDFSKEFLSKSGCMELLGKERYEMLKDYILKMQQTEMSAKRDGLKSAGRRYELGESDGYKPHVCVVSEKGEEDIEYSEVALGYAKRDVIMETMGKMGLKESVQLIEFDANNPEENAERLKKIITSERALKDLRHGDEKSEEEVLSTLFDLLKNQDEQIANHSMREACLSSIIMMMAHDSEGVPKRFKIPVGEMKKDIVASGLHDVGKRLGVVVKELFGTDKEEPTYSFIEELGRNTSKFFELPAEARNAIREHSSVGAKAIGAIRKFVDGEVLEEAEKIASSHHVDYKSRGEVINDDPLVNVNTIADCIDAIISGRSYNNFNEPMTLEGTVDILIRDMGGSIEVFREIDDERVPVKPGEWFMDENIKFHINEQKIEESPKIKFNPYLLMPALKFLRHQAVESDKGKKTYMSFNDETISPDIKEKFEQIKNVTEEYEVNGYRQKVSGERHLATSFAGIPMEQNAVQEERESKSIIMDPLAFLEDFAKMKMYQKQELRRVARGGGDYCPAR